MVAAFKRGRQELIGMSDDGDANSDSVPIKPEQLIGLLDHLQEEGKSEVWLMVALVGMYGLRPAELAALSDQTVGCTSAVRSSATEAP